MRACSVLTDVRQVVLEDLGLYKSGHTISTNGGLTFLFLPIINCYLLLLPTGYKGLYLTFY